MTKLVGRAPQPWFWITAGLVWTVLLLSIVESALDGDLLLWTSVSYLPHSLAARIIDVPRAILSLGAIGSWFITSALWVKGWLHG